MRIIKLDEFGYIDYSVDEYGGVYYYNELLHVSRRKDGRPYVTICGKKIPTYRLVALAFLGPKPLGLIVCHEDGNCKNNHYTNLRYDTYQSNAIDRVKHGVQITKLNIEIVNKLRREYDLGKTATKLAIENKLSYEMVRRAVKRETWKMI